MNINNSPINQQTQQDNQELAQAFLSLQTLSDQYRHNPLSSFRDYINKKAYPQLKTDSLGRVVGLVTTLNKEERASIDKVNEYVKKIIKKSSNEYEQSLILDQLLSFERLEKEALLNAVKDRDAISNKLKALGAKKEGEPETFKTDDGRLYTCTKFITPHLSRKIKLYEDLDGPIALVYPSKKGKNIKNNCKVKALDGSDIVCEDIASFQIRNRNLNWREVLGDKEKIKKEKWLNSHQIRVQQFAQKGNDVYKCSRFNVGEALYALSMNSKNQKPAGLFNTINHMMSVSIEKRKKGGVLLKFYDPNHSDNNIRILTPSPYHLKKLTIDALLRNNIELGAYFPKEKPIDDPVFCKDFKNYLYTKKSDHTLSGYFTSYDDLNNPTGTWENTKINTFTPKSISDDPVLSRKWLVENLDISMKINGNDVKDLIHAILNSGDPKEVKYQCMKALIPTVDYPKPVPVIAFALNNGCMEATKAYVEAVLNHNEFSDQEKYELLGGLKDGDSYLYFAFFYNRKETLLAFTQAVAEAPHFPSIYKINLLRARMKGAHALAKASNELQKTFFKFIRDCKNLSYVEKNEILLDILI